MANAHCWMIWWKTSQKLQKLTPSKTGFGREGQTSTHACNAYSVHFVTSQKFLSTTFNVFNSFTIFGVKKLLKMYYYLWHYKLRVLKFKFSVILCISFKNHGQRYFSTFSVAFYTALLEIGAMRPFGTPINEKGQAWLSKFFTWRFFRSIGVGVAW